MADSPRLQQIRAMLADDPDDPFLRYAIAMEYVSLGDDEAAVAAFAELADAKPDYVATYIMWAQTLQKVGRSTEASEALRRGITAAQKVNDLHALGELQGMLAIVE